MNATKKPSNKTNEDMMLAVCQNIWKQIKSKWGNGWRCLGEEIQRAIITESVFHLFAGRAGHAGYTVTPQEMYEYLGYMLNFCGIDVPEDKPEGE